MSRSRSKSPTRRSAQPATFRPSISGNSALYGGLSASPASLSPLSLGSQSLLDDFFPTSNRPLSPLLAQPATFQAGLPMNLSGRRQAHCFPVSVVSPHSPPCFLSPNFSPGTIEMMQVAFGPAPTSQPKTFSPPSSNSGLRSPRLL